LYNILCTVNTQQHQYSDIMYAIDYTLVQHSTVNCHHQANKEYLLKIQKGSTQWDPILFTVEYKIMYKELLFTIKMLVVIK